MLRTHSVLVDDIYNGHQLASMGSERDVGYTANLNEAFEHLRQIRTVLEMTEMKTGW